MAKTINLVDVAIVNFGFYKTSGTTPEWWCQCRYNAVSDTGEAYNTNDVRFRVPTPYQDNIQVMRDWLYQQVKTREGI